MPLNALSLLSTAGELGAEMIVCYVLFKQVTKSIKEGQYKPQRGEN